ncbi:MAG: DUF2520 domain-containing protein, partial [Gemmatimonadota bacterium]|nr:DUF2520 domain-containing protein [Gemmatimonadota bacterium]
TEQLRRAWIGIDGDEAARAASRELAAAIGARVLEIPEGMKARYHAAAVFASNFPMVLLATATRLLTSAGVPEDTARGALGTLLVSAAENASAMGPAKALTGPVARGDAETVRAHLNVLADVPEVLELYRVLSLGAVGVAEEGGADRARFADLLEMLGKR